MISGGGEKMDETQKQQAETMLIALATIARDHETKRAEVIHAILGELKSINNKLETLTSIIVTSDR